MDSSAVSTPRTDGGSSKDPSEGSSNVATIGGSSKLNDVVELEKVTKRLNQLCNKLIKEATSTANSTTPLISGDGQTSNVTSISPSPSPFFLPGSAKYIPGTSDDKTSSDWSRRYNNREENTRFVPEGMVDDLPGGVQSGSNLVVRFQSPTDQTIALDEARHSKSLTMLKNDGSFFVQAVHPQKDGANLRFGKWSPGQKSDDPSSVELDNPSFVSSGTSLLY